MRSFNWLLLLGVIFTTCSCKADENMTIEDIQNSLAVGMSRNQVESFFDENGIEYTFVSREDDKGRVPEFSWKAENAVGYYGALIRDVGTAWLMLSSEHIEIRAEIDAQDKVSQVVVKKAYTGP